MSKAFKKKLEEVFDRLAPLSPSVSKILELTNDINASPKDLLDIIKIDPVLTGKILKVINSAFYSLPNQVTNLNKALILMGFNTIKNLALSTAVIDNVHGSTNSELDTTALWDHCLSVAVASKSLARATSIPPAQLEEYFISGLLHDIGRVVTIQHLPNLYKEVLTLARHNNISLLEAERDVLGIDHCEAGTLVGAKWQLPESLMKVIAHHHDESEHLGICIVHVADKFCKKNDMGFDADKNYRIHKKNIHQLGLSPEQVIGALENLSTDVEKARVLLST